MTQKHNLIKQPFAATILIKRMLFGAGIALILIAIFLLPVGEPDPEWGRYWMIRPLIIVPMVGAAGGSFYHFMDYLRHHNGWNKGLVIVISLIAYMVALWLGTILGLDGTLWD